MSAEFTQDYFTKQFRELGLHEGDLVLVHSSVEGAPFEVAISCYNALIEAVGKSGTVVFPTFNFSFCQGASYDHLKTPSHMGLLTEMARRSPKASRIFHPIYSFAMLGAQAQKLAATIRNTSSYADDSFFGELRRQNGKILLIKLPFNKSMTFFHHVEEMVGCDYRYMKDFTGDVVDEKGVTTKKTAQIFVRDLDAGVVTYLDEIQKRMEVLNLVKLKEIGPWPVRLMEAAKIFDATKEILKKEPHILRRIEKKN